MDKLAIIYSENYLKYDLGPGNPIPRDKTRIFLEKIKTEGKINYEIIEPENADEKDLLLVHTPRYLAELKHLALSNLEFDPDTPVNQGMLEGGLYIVGGSILCLNLVLKGRKAVNLIGGMHHAGPASASGFCIYNDHAIAIRKLQKEGKIKKAKVYDLDVHAGQGTQEIFYSDASVMTVSIHQDPFTIYPGTGFESQKGKGKGLGTNLNKILPPGTQETEYLKALDWVIEQTGNFKTDLSILVLGVDTYRDDLLGGLSLDEDTYGKIGERFRDFEKLAVLFGGGYSTKIPDLWMSFLRGFLGK
jgi:acetoin utilization protein AcuC